LLANATPSAHHGYRNARQAGQPESTRLGEAIAPDSKLDSPDRI
jgi:hypothetical protein